MIDKERLNELLNTLIIYGKEFIIAQSRLDFERAHKVEHEYIPQTKQQILDLIN